MKSAIIITLMILFLIATLVVLCQCKPTPVEPYEPKNLMDTFYYIVRKVIQKRE